MPLREDSQLRQSTRVCVPADDEALLTAQQICAKFGGISEMTLWRWLGSDVVRFPKPASDWVG